MDLDLSDSSILSIGDMISFAFGDPDNNVVDHKLVQAILYLLARQLKLLERRVVVEIRGGIPLATGAGLTVSEVKLHAILPSQIKSMRGSLMLDLDKSSSSSRAGGSDTSAGVKGKGGRGAPRDTGKAGARRPDGKTSRTDLDSRIPEEPRDAKKKELRGKRVSLADDDQVASEKSSLDIKKSDVLIPSKKPTKKSKPEKKIPQDATEELSPEPADQGAADQIDANQMDTDQEAADQIPTDQASDDKSVTSDKISSEKSSSDKSLAEGTTKPADRSVPSKKTDTKARTRTKEQDYLEHLESLEELMERELRVIHQRADSREEQDESPIPIASLDSIERGKLLIVEPKTPEDQAAKGRGGVARTPKLSIVTQEQFAKLAAMVRQLQNKFAPIPSPEFTDNAKLMDDLRRGASLTDGMAALQLSARLEAAEKTLKQMGSLVTDLASETPGINLKEFQAILAGGKDGTEVIFEAPGARSQSPGGKSKKGIPTMQQDKGTRDARETAPGNLDRDQMSIAGADYGKGPQDGQGARSSKSTVGDGAGSRGAGGLPRIPLKSSSQETFDLDTQYEDEYVETTEDMKDKVTYKELDDALQNMFDDVMKQLQVITNRSNANSDNTLKIANKLEKKVESSINLGDKMYDLENVVSDYAEQINRLDTGISSQMTDYQEQLTQMQHDLEVGLETLAEVLGNPTGDPVAVAELNSRFTSLQGDIESTMLRQKELKESQKIMALDLQALRAQIELLRDNKSDRDEVADALEDKVGLGALNGLVNRQQFDAVRGDLEKRIAAAYDEFNGQEVLWQKAIDDLVRELNEKCDIIQVTSLKDEIARNIKILRDRIDAIKEIVGEPRMNALMKKIHHDGACLSCATPAYMDLEEPKIVPALPAARPQAIGESRPPAIGAEAPPMVDTVYTKGDGYRPCYAGYPIPHPRDPRAHICQRYCGGSHTVVASTLSRAPPGVVVTPFLRNTTTTEVGTDGKTYIVDTSDMVPCLPCNVPKKLTPQPSVTAEVKGADSGLTPMDLPFRTSSFGVVVTAQEEIIFIPPPTTNK